MNSESALPEKRTTLPSLATLQPRPGGFESTVEAIYFHSYVEAITSGDPFDSIDTLYAPV
jgi:hypothetical protein